LKKKECEAGDDYNTDYFCHKVQLSETFWGGDSAFLGDTDFENQVLFMQ